MNVSVNINKIILDGDQFCDVDPRQLRALMTTELTSQMTSPEFEITGSDSRRVEGGRVVLPSNSLGKDLAVSVSSSLCSNKQG